MVVADGVAHDIECVATVADSADADDVAIVGSQRYFVMIRGFRRRWQRPALRTSVRKSTELGVRPLVVIALHGRYRPFVEGLDHLAPGPGRRSTRSPRQRIRIALLRDDVVEDDEQAVVVAVNVGDKRCSHRPFSSLPCALYVERAMPAYLSSKNAFSRNSLYVGNAYCPHHILQLDRQGALTGYVRESSLELRQSDPVGCQEHRRRNADASSPVRRESFRRGHRCPPDRKLSECVLGSDQSAQFLPGGGLCLQDISVMFMPIQQWRRETSGR